MPLPNRKAQFDKLRAKLDVMEKAAETFDASEAVFITKKADLNSLNIQLNIARSKLFTWSGAPTTMASDDDYINFGLLNKQVTAATAELNSMFDMQSALYRAFSAAYAEAKPEFDDLLTTPQP